jgi:DNA polymerase III subunit gamma/tau
MSDNYIVSARKYRPQTFDTVVGQEHITTTLKNAIKNQHLAHAYLFCGPRGVGKTTCARILAKTINCESPTADMEACGSCSTCVTFKDSTSFNVFELDAASNNSVDDIRELTNQVRFAPQHGKYKIYIIDEVHMLSASAFNAFLKTLEEPPPYAIFILATTEKHKILPTILSRCQIFDFKRITTHDIVAHLQGIASKESMIAQEAALHVIAQKSEGCMRDALSMLDRIASFTNGMLTYANTMEHLNLLDADYYFRLTDAMLCQDVAAALLHLDNALEKGFEGDVIISGLAEHFRNLMLCKDGRMARLLDVPNEHKPMYNEKANQTPPSFIISALNVLNDSELQYKTATNKRLHVELCLIRLCFLLQFTSPGPGIDNMGFEAGNIAGEKKNTNSALAVPAATPVAAMPPTVSSGQNAPYNSERQAPISETHILQEPALQTPMAAPVTPPAAAQVPPAADTAARPTHPAPAARRVSMDMLGDLEADLSNAAALRASKPTEITAENALEIFEQYKQELKAADKSVLYTQFCMVRLEIYPPDEVRIISGSHMTDTYVREQRNAMIDFYLKHSRMTVRITTDVQIDTSQEEDQNAKVLSKSEMYDAMAALNPNLARLKEGAGLQIEY